MSIGSLNLRKYLVKPGTSDRKGIVEASLAGDKIKASKTTLTRPTRRVILESVGIGTVALASAPLRKAWATTTNGVQSPMISSSSKSSGPDFPVASSSNPQTLPIFADNAPIASGKSPEKGPLIVYNWAGYLSPAVVKSFEQRYGVTVEVSNYDTVEEAINKMRTGAVRADLWVPGTVWMSPLAQAKMIQPINQSYIPNLSKAISAAANPWYDVGSRYSTPNFINTLGIGWRGDLVKIDPASNANPWQTFWKLPPKTPVGMVNSDTSMAICMALLASGFTNFDRISQKDIQGAVKNLQQLNGLKLQYSAFQPLATGAEDVAFCYNGDMLMIQPALPPKTPITEVQYFFPKDGRGIIINDMWTIPTTAANPVLAHLFMNHFLELDSAIANFRDIGYQTMLTDLTLEKLTAAKVADPYVLGMVYSPPVYQENGLALPVWNSNQKAWFETAFDQLVAG